MWWQRKKGNRRLKRTHVLDVKLRSDQVRKARMRVTALALGALFGTVLGVYGLWLGGQWLLNQMVYQNPAFAIREIETTTDGVIAPDQLRRWANVRPGQNLLALDLARVKRNLEMVPVIESVAIERVLPRTLRIRVTEREPVLQVAILVTNAQRTLENRIFHLDGNGVVMLPLNPSQRTQPLGPTEGSLPLLLGVKLSDIKPGRPVESSGVKAALRLAQEFVYSPMAGIVDLKRIDATASDVLVVTTGQGSEITFGLENLDQQLRRWRQVHDEGLRMRKGPLASLDLSVANNAPARWFDASVVPPSPRPAQPVRYNRRRNV